MGSNGNGGFGFELNTGISTPRSNFPFCSSFLVPYCESSSGIATGSGASCLKTGPVYPPEMVEPFSACWDSLVSTDGNDSSGGELSSKGHQEKLYQLNQRGEINLAGYHSSVSLAGSASSFPCLLNSRYPDNMTNYILLDSTTNSTVSPSDHQLSDTNQGIHIDECTTNTNGKIVGSAAKELEGVDGNIADREEEGRVLSPLLLDTRKRKRMPDGFTSHLTPNIDHAQRNESDQPRDSSHFSNDSMKTKKEEIVGGGDHGKLKARGENRDQNLNAEDQKEYIHVRARRGQATNSHSLAERVRREKISERMRFLQDLVPGCSKVTGKAVMLDEIINYVQSLQHQVEFLSMKLATVIPDFDVRDIVLKNIFSSEGERRSSGVIGFTPNINPSCHTINGYPLESIERGAEELQNIKNLSNTLRNTNPQFVQMEQVPNTWDNELQNVIQMHFVPQSSIGVPPKNGFKM